MNSVTIHYYYLVTPSNTHHPLSHSRIQVGSEQIIENRVTICIYSYIKNIITYRSSNKIRIHHLGIT
jgi:hypothetical protein